MINMKGTVIATYVLGALIVAGFFALLAILIFRPAPEQNSDLLNISIGALLSAFTGVVGYFYGSSIGSKEKTDLLNKKEV